MIQWIIEHQNTILYSLMAVVVWLSIFEEDSGHGI
jgi:hypothetical protein